MRYGNYSFSLLLLLSSCSQLTLPIRGDRPVVLGVPSGGELELYPRSVRSREPIRLMHSDQEGFCVIDNGYGSVRKPVPSYRAEGILSKLNNRKLRSFIEQDGYISVSKLAEDDYKLTACTRGKGGGFGLGWIFYSATKATLWATFFCLPNTIAKRRASRRQLQVLNELTKQGMIRNVGAPGATQLGGAMVNNGYTEAGSARAVSISVAANLAGMSVPAWIEAASMAAWGVGMAIFPPA